VTPVLSKEVGSMSVLVPAQARSPGLWSVVALMLLLGVLGAGSWFVSANGKTSACCDSTCPLCELTAKAPAKAKTTDCCDDPTCPPGCSPACPPDCLGLTAKVKTTAKARDCCPPGEVCPDCLPVAQTTAKAKATACCDSVCPPCESESKTRTTAAKKYICPPCPFCPGR
jgi:hypothetical protein